MTAKIRNKVYSFIYNYKVWKIFRNFAVVMKMKNTPLSQAQLGFFDV